MSNIPQDLRYTAEHEWAKSEGALVRVGITDHAQEKLGDVVYVELPKAGSSLTAGKPFGAVESVKAVSELFAPVSGEVTAVNAALENSPELVNSDPYGAGWMLLVRPVAPQDVEGLLAADAYASLISQG